jgi:hypothetical protein
MTRYKIASTKLFNIDVIIVPVSPSFGSKTKTEQNEFIKSIKTAAQKRKLNGIVIVMWSAGIGQTDYVAQQELYSLSFLESWISVMSFDDAIALINDELIL